MTGTGTGTGNTATTNASGVNFTAPRSSAKVFKSSIKETLFPDDPFRQFKNQPPLVKSKKAIQYLFPITEWLPKYSFQLFRYDLLAGITIASLAIPQGISYAKLADIPPIIGLYSSFVPPIIYALLGSSNDIAIGNVGAASLLLAATIRKVVSPDTQQTLYLHLVFTAAFFTGIFQIALGVFRLGILVDFLSHSTIVGFMSGTAIIITLQQLKGFLGLNHFTTKTNVVSVMHSIFSQTHEWRWESALVGITFLSFLLITREVKKRNERLFWVSAIGPIIVVVVGCVFAYLVHADKHGIPTIGHLSKGLNPPSIHLLNFDSKYLPTVLTAGIVSGILALAEGIAIGRNFAVQKKYHIDGNKEMIAFGIMNLIGSFTSCYLTTGPFSKSAVNNNAGCKTPMSNVVMAICMMLVLLFLAPVFKYTPLVALSAIITSAMLGLIDYEAAYRLFKVDKFDFVIAMAAFFGVIFISMDVGLIMSVGLAILRALLYVSRPPISNVGKLPDKTFYRDIEQYPSAARVPGILILQLGSPILFATSSYVRDRITRWIEDEQKKRDDNNIEHLILDFGGVTSIDMTGLEMLQELRRTLEGRGIKVSIANPRLEVTEKLMAFNLNEIIGMESVFLSIDDAVEACHLKHNELQQKNSQALEEVDLIKKDEVFLA